MIGSVFNSNTEKELTGENIVLYNNGKSKWFTKSALMKEYFPTVDLKRI